MCIFVKLTCINGNTVSYINMDTIKCIKLKEDGTRLYYKHKKYVTVTESPWEINHKIREIERSKQ